MPRFALAPAAWAAGYRLLAFPSVGSTSEEAMEAARAGDVGRAWFVSDHQSAGRGRRGSDWSTPSGNLAASLLLVTDLPPATLAQLGFVASVALGRALSACCEERASLAPVLDGGDGPDGRFSLKWPNDVLAGGAKLAGILLSTQEIGGGRRAVVIGIGVNVVATPPGLPYPAASLAALGAGVGAAELFEALSAAWVAVHAEWDGGRGFEAVRHAWLARAAGLGAAVAVRTGAGVTRGTFETIDGHGQLVVRVPDGSLATVSAGEVHFGTAATVRPESRA